MFQQPPVSRGWFIPLSSSSSRRWWRGSGALSVNRSRGIGGAPLQQEGVAGVADSDRFRRGGQRQLVVWAAVAENLPAVATVVLETDERLTECSSREMEQLVMVRGPTFLLEMENSFSQSLQWLASLSFNQTWPPWNNRCAFGRHHHVWSSCYTSTGKITGTLPEELCWLL